ncbi:MAG: hypothetical protein V1792_15255 [Pseudomonadota bacterium]
MRTPTALTLVVTALQAVLPCAEAQWPLGRDAVQPAKTEPGPTVTVNGRFQIFTSPHEKGDTFMLDTDTGRVWLLKKDKTSGDFAFGRIRVEEVDSASPEKPLDTQSKSKDTQPSKDN